MGKLENKSSCRIDLLARFSQILSKLNITRHDLELGFSGPTFVGDGDRFQVDKREVTLEQVFIAFICQIGRITLFIRSQHTPSVEQKIGCGRSDFQS